MILRRLISLNRKPLLFSKDLFSELLLSCVQTTDFRLVTLPGSGCDTNCGCSGASRATCRDHLRVAPSLDQHLTETKLRCSLWWILSLCRLPVFIHSNVWQLRQLWFIAEAICLFSQLMNGLSDVLLTRVQPCSADSLRQDTTSWHEASRCYLRKEFFILLITHFTDSEATKENP